MHHFSLRSLSACGAAALSLLSACAPAADLPDVALVDALPAMRWDHSPQADAWTEATLVALRSEGAPLLSEVPADIMTWCPGYPQAEDEDRAAFWAGLLSALAEYESTWNPRAVGGGGQWFGLVQISPATARGYGCDARSGDALRDGAENLACAVRIAASTVPRDGVVAAGRGGLAADWGPFANSRHRAAMAAWTRAQPFCRMPTAGDASIPG